MATAKLKLNFSFRWDIVFLLVYVLVPALLTLTVQATHAQISDGVVKIGVLNDLSGPYATLAGPGSGVAALMAVEDFGAPAKGMKVEVVFADHQNKPDVGASIARALVRRREGGRDRGC